MSSTTSHRDARPSRWSIATRLTAWYLGASFVILLVAAVALYLILGANLRREQDQFLSEKVGVLRRMLLRPDNSFELREEVEQTWAPRQYARVLGRVIDGRGRIVVESPHMDSWLGIDAFPPPVGPDTDPQRGVAMQARTAIPVRVMSAEARMGDGTESAVIQVALDTRLTHELLVEYRRTLLLVLAFGLAGSAATGYLLARHALRPLRKIAATARSIRSSNLDERIEIGGLPTEVAALAGSFNSMLERLEDSFDRLSRFSADIAHELRSPVSNLRIEAEVALGKARSLQEYQETLASCLEEYDRLTRIIDSMLFIARAEDPRTQIHREPVDLSRELERVREFYEAPAAEAGVSLEVACPAGTGARLDRTLLQRAVGNLVANSIRHTPRGGRVELGAVRENGELRIEVLDSGTGIAPTDLPNVFDRFYRADRARSTATGNVGLGLAIVKSIVTLHGGSISAANRPAGGTRMTIRMPAAEETPAPAGRA